MLEEDGGLPVARIGAGLAAVAQVFVAVHVKVVVAPHAGQPDGGEVVALLHPGNEGGTVGLLGEGLEPDVGAGGGVQGQTPRPSWRNKALAFKRSLSENK